MSQNKLLRAFFNPEEKKGSAKIGILVGCAASFGGILYGYDTGNISGILAMDYVKKHFPDNKTSFTSSEHSLIVSILSVGTFVGSLMGSWFADMFGRRATIIASSMIVFNIGVILQTIATGIPLMCAGRVVGGLGVGLISTTIPLYQAECTPKWIRGALISSYQFAITIGLLLASCVDQGTHARNDSGSYRIPIAIQIVWALVLCSMLVFLPESPRYYIMKGQEDKALRALGRLHSLEPSDPAIVEEFNDIKANHEYELAQGSATWIDVFRPKNAQLKRVFTACAMQMFQQLTGINFIFYFGTTFFQSSGIANSFLISIATNVVNVGASLPGMLAIETVGRRNLLLIGSVGMCVCDFIISIVGVCTNSSSANKVLVAFTCIFIAFFASSWGPIAWVITGEIFPLKVRAKSIALATASNWLFNFAIAYATPYLVDDSPGSANLGSKVFFIWGGCNVLGLFFTWFFIYETKGYTLEEIEELYQTVPHAWQSKGFTPSYDKHVFQEKRAEEINNKSTVSHQVSTDNSDKV